MTEFKIVVEPELSFEFKSWLFKNKMQRFEDINSTVKRMDYKEEKVEEVTIGGEESFIFCTQEIMEYYDVLREEGSKIPGTDKDEALINKLFSEDVIYFEIELKLDYYTE